MKAVILTILIYSFIITIVDIIKDCSSYSFGMESVVDVIIAGPCMWVFVLLLYIIRPIYSKYRKNHPKKKRAFTEKEIQRTVNVFLRKYKKLNKKYDEPLWLVKDGYFQDFYFTLYKPYELKLRKIIYEPLENRYHSMCFNNPESVWAVFKSQSKPITESKDWTVFSEKLWKSDIEKLLKCDAIEIL